MSGQQERRSELDRPGQPDSTLIMAEFAGRDQAKANGQQRNWLAQDAAPAETDGLAQASEPRGYSEAQPAIVARRADNAGSPAEATHAVAGGPADEPQRLESKVEHGGAHGSFVQAPTEREPLPYRAAAISGPAEPGSLADLKQRLETLPYGHPSSPYHVDGVRKPPPPRLKHLELAPPGRAAAARADPADLTHPGAAPASPDGQAEVALHTTAGGLAAERATDVTTPLSPEAPTPWGASPDDDRYRAASLFTPASGRADQARSALAAPQHGGAADHATSPLAGRDRELGPGHEAPRSAGDGSWSWGSARLTRDQVRIAEDAYDRFRAAEGRNLFGGYERGAGLSAAMRRIEEQVTRGRLAPGTEQHALLAPDVFRARFADLLRRHPDWTAEQLSRRVPGALTYVFVLDAEDYADGITAIEQALYTQGFQLQARKNSWNNAASRCVITIWHDPLDDLPFQVQFHTATSPEAQRPGNADSTDLRRTGDASRR